ncbi:transposase [Aneurinibacillus sp. Ricciae_BoGa-3]|uniref:RNA-guided endonuclease InsQ/TnpB family protein n=1 Tax=Aneurinibacillus sp. Ricciae_BoGa-3 TaxID=3022697 RepID=UPI00233FF339|nr:transposase [Aneurinibacillus sp. Ricciae_BoGa-3]WCK54249.1 transposase [Aneurinibacillus sp. Ricciae_BoGa-3]
MKIIKEMRYQIVKPIDSDWKTFEQVLRVLQQETRTALNRTIQLAWEYHGFSASYKDTHGVYPNNKDILNYQRVHGYAYKRIRTECPNMYSKNLSQTIKRAADKWKSCSKDVLRGDSSIPSYGKDQPLDLVNTSLKVFKNYQHYIVEIGLTSTKFREELGRANNRFQVLIHSGEKAKRIILDRIIDNTYKLGVGKIIKRHGNWFLHLNYQFEKKEATPLDPDSIMGIDLGLNNAVYMAFNHGLQRYKIVGSEIENFRKQIQQRRKQLLVESKYAGPGRSGHGIKTKIAPLDVLANKVENFRNYMNHKYARYIVKMALKHRCATIQMEDLTGINKTSAFLKNWSYYDLQKKIEYKANEVGIQVIKMNPQYTSQRCNRCGYINKENRDKQIFECLDCGLKINADFNAAKNIATANIEKIIAETIIKQTSWGDSDRPKIDEVSQNVGDNTRLRYPQ